MQNIVRAFRLLSTFSKTRFFSVYFLKLYFRSLQPIVTYVSHRSYWLVTWRFVYLPGWTKWENYLRHPETGWSSSFENFSNHPTVTKSKFMCSMQSEAKQTETSEFVAEKGLLQDHARRPVAQAPNSSKGFGKAKWGKGVVSCCELLGVGILCSCSCPRRSGHDVPVNLQQDKYYSLFCNFLSLYEWTLKGQGLENRLSCIVQAVGNILLWKVQSQHD